MARLRVHKPLDRCALGIGLLGIRLGVLHQMQHDAGAAARRVGRLGHRDGKRALAVRGPNMRRVAAGAARKDLDALRHHECRIEADAEAADQRSVLVVFGRFKPIDERLGAGARDGAQRLDQLLAAHADAVVLDHELPLLGIDRDRDAWLRVVAKERGLSDRLVAQPLAGVGRIRDQFAQKHRLLGIDRVHNQLQQLGDIRFEWAAFRSVLLGNCHGGIPAIFLTRFVGANLCSNSSAEMARAGGAVKPRH